MKPGERPVLTSVVIVPGQVSNVQDTKLIDASGAVSPKPFTGVVQPLRTFHWTKVATSFHPATV